MDEGEKYFTLIEKEEDLDKIVSDSPPEKGESEGVTKKGIHNNVTHPNLPFSGKEWKHDTVQMGEKLALLTQTTLSVDDTASLIAKIQKKYPDIILPKAGDICYATTNRQKAVKVLAERVDVVLVVGSKNSSNSSKLQHVAEDMGKRAYLIDSSRDIDRVWFERISSIGVTA
jgi:(E)-4-hydroxy-3-methyl-but-2-enyl pyrophosphate reductase